MSPRILIADDREDTRLRIAILAEQNGFEVVEECASGWQALECFSRLHPDVAIVDLNLPDVSGLQVTQRILEVAPNTLVVIASSFENPAAMGQAFHAGAHRCIRKPIRSDELNRLLENINSELEQRAPVGQ